MPDIKVVSVDNIIINNHFYYSISFLKIYAKYKQLVKTNFLKLKFWKLPSNS